jgi:hypothetical protein
MKINKSVAPQEFRPITITMVIEHQAELEALIEFSSYNRSHPEQAVRQGHLQEDNKEIIVEFLGDLYDTLGAL